MRLSSCIIIFCLFFVLIECVQVEQRTEAVRQTNTARNASSALKYQTRKYAGNANLAFTIEDQQYDGVKSKVKRDATEEAKRKAKTARGAMNKAKKGNRDTAYAYEKAQEDVNDAIESTSNSTRSFETAQQTSENAARMFAAAKGDPKDNERRENAKAADVEAVRHGVEAEATYGKAKEAYSIVHTKHVSLEQLLSKMETASAEVENLISAAQNAFEELGESRKKLKQRQVDDPKEEFEKSCKKTKIVIEEYHALKRKLDSAKEKNKLANEAFQRANALRLKARDAFEVAEKEWKTASKHSTAASPQPTIGPEQTHSGNLAKNHLIFVIVFVFGQL